MIEQTVPDNAEGAKPVEPATSNQQSWHWKTMMMLATVVGLYVGLRIWSLWTPHLWGDEVFSFSLSQGSWITLVKRAGLDMAHPPLFYFLLKPWLYVAGSSMSGLRILPVMFSIATVVPLIELGRKLRFQMPIIILTLTLMAVNSYLILYGYYLRSYSLLLFLSLTSQALFVRFLLSRATNQRKSLVMLTVVNVLFVYTHYFAWLTIAAEYLWIAVMDRRHLRQFTFATAIVGLCFLPWVGVIVYVSTKVPYTFLDQISWYQPPGLHNLLLLFRCFTGGFDSTGLTLAGSLIVMLIVLAGSHFSFAHSSFAQSDSVNLTHKDSLNSYALLAWLTLFPIIVSEAVSRVFTWKWEPRYVIVAAGSYLLLVSAAAFSIRNRYVRALCVVFLLAWCSIAAFSTDNLSQVLHGPNGTSFMLARDLSQRETRSVGPISIYGISPYAEQGLRLALNLTGEHRFQTRSCSPDVAFSEDYFWIAITEHDPTAAARVKDLSSGQLYELGEPIYSGEFPKRHILIPVRRK
jgi:hypothetical protein